MYSEKMEQLIKAALVDGVLTEKEKQILFKRAQEQGIDLDEFEMVLDARLVELQKAEKEKAEKSAPKSTKFGDVRKCPVCGALVPALAVSCAECGYEFSNVETTFSSALLYDKLFAAEQATYKLPAEGFFEDMRATAASRQKKIDKLKLKAKIQIIESFPVPMTKADLFDFMNYIKPHIKWGKLAKAYRKKISECLLKAKTLHSKDSNFEKLIAEIERDLKIRKIIVTTIYMVLLLSILSLVGLVALKPRTAANNVKVCTTEVNASIANGDLSTAYRLVINFEGDALKIEGLYKMLIDNCVEINDRLAVSSLIRKFESATENTSSLAWNGTIITDPYKVDALVRVGDYEMAERRLNLPEADFWNGTSKRNQKYYDFLARCVADMVAKGYKSEARQYISKKVSFYSSEPRKLSYNDEPNPYYIETIKSKLNALVK
jgi:hypothetical protein